MTTTTLLERWSIERFDGVRLPITSVAAVSSAVSAIVDRGFPAPLVVDRRGRLIEGAALLIAARMLGIAEVPVIENEVGAVKYIAMRDFKTDQGDAYVRGEVVEVTEERAADWLKDGRVIPASTRQVPGVPLKDQPIRKLGFGDEKKPADVPGRKPIDDAAEDDTESE